MKSDMRTENIARESVLKLLSDDEVASVSTAETATRLLDAEEYLDLEELERGVQQARKAGPAMDMCCHEEPCTRIRGARS